MSRGGKPLYVDLDYDRRTIEALASKLEVSLQPFCYRSGIEMIRIEIRPKKGGY
jgi:hypothetical protein